ncbi:hypothetical protein D3C80_1891160 [compost metagenome]
MLIFGAADRPATDAVLTIAPPPWASSNGSWYFMHNHTPLTLTPMIASNSASLPSAKRPFSISMPALLRA